MTKFLQITLFRMRNNEKNCETLFQSVLKVGANLQDFKGVYEKFSFLILFSKFRVFKFIFLKNYNFKELFKKMSKIL